MVLFDALVEVLLIESHHDVEILLSCLSAHETAEELNHALVLHHFYDVHLSVLVPAVLHHFLYSNHLAGFAHAGSEHLAEGALARQVEEFDLLTDHAGGG